MALNNLMVELMVPRSPKTTERLNRFYQAIGWNIWADSHEGENGLYVRPPVDIDQPTTVMYWQTTTEAKTKHFVEGPDGFCLPQLNNLVEVVFVLPSTDDVRRVWDEGGSELQSRAYKPIEDYFGGLDMRFADPFNYALRVTTNPGYELVPPTNA